MRVPTATHGVGVANHGEALVVWLDDDSALLVARSLAARFGADLFCKCGRAYLDDAGTCPRCAEELLDP
jgi:hypothetical protein